jgi:hypothetical protein
MCAALTLHACTCSHWPNSCASVQKAIFRLDLYELKEKVNDSINHTICPGYVKIRQSLPSRSPPEWRRRPPFIPNPRSPPLPLPLRPPVDASGGGGALHILKDRGMERAPRRLNMGGGGHRLGMQGGTTMAAAAWCTMVDNDKEPMSHADAVVVSGGRSGPCLIWARYGPWFQLDQKHGARCCAAFSSVVLLAWVIGSAGAAGLTNNGGGPKILLMPRWRSVGCLSPSIWWECRIP